MDISHPILRTAAATVLATAGLAIALPAVAHAETGDYSFLVVVKNETGQVFTMYRHRLGEGEWATNPATSISSSSSDTFQVQSKDDGDRASANIYYRTTSGQEILISINNVNGTKNYYWCGVPSDLSCDTTVDASGAHASFTFSIG